jgi:hypothetical protein
MRKAVMATVASASAVTSLFAATAYGYPVDPAKVPVAIGQDPSADHDFVLAYDSEDKSVVYYAPKSGRLALMNGLPMIGYAKAPSGEAVLNAQLEFGVFGTEKDTLLSTISKAGFVPRPLPYTRTAITPVTPGIDPNTGHKFCTKVTDPSTGQTSEDCDASLYDVVSYSRSGPTLGENIAISANLSKFGASVYETMLKGGDAIQLDMDAEYYKAGTAFTATVTVNWSKLFESFHAFAGFSGIIFDVDLETFWKREGLCYGKPASDCSVLVTYTDARGKTIDNVTVDPDDKDAQEALLQAVDRLRDQLQAEMLTPLGPSLGPLDKSKPLFGFKLSAQYEQDNVEKHATFQFKSPNGVNIGHTTAPAGIACVSVGADGTIARSAEGDCAGYWTGSIGFADILAKQVAGPGGHP